MKYLSHYTEAAQTKLFNDCGAFFAFSTKQYEEAKQDGVKYVSCGSGLICEKQHVMKLANGLDSIQQSGMAMDMEENGREAIINRELGNHEAQITGDISDTVDCLEPYGITRDEIQAAYPAYFQHCVDNDYF